MRNTTRANSITLLAVTQLLLAVGCGPQAGTEDILGEHHQLSETQVAGAEHDHGVLSRGSDTAPFAAFTTEHSGLIEFFEPAPGELVLTVSRRGALPEALAELELDELYFELAGEPLPARFLLEEEDGANAPTEASFGEQEADLEAPAEDSLSADPTLKSTNYKSTTSSTSAEKLSSSQFCGRYSWAYYCWTRITGTSWGRKRTGHIQSWAHSYRGKIKHVVKGKSVWGSWSTKHTARIDSNTTSYIRYYVSSSTKTEKESHVSEASGDGYHHAMWFD